MIMDVETLLVAAVRPPALWRRIDVTGNRRRHPANTEAKKDQQDTLRGLSAADRQYEDEHNRPGDGQAGAVYPIVSVPKHLLSLFLSYFPVREGTRTLESSLHGKSQPGHVLSVYLIISILIQIPRESVRAIDGVYYDQEI